MKKLSYENVKNYIESNGHILISDTYINSQTKLSLRCPKNHKFDVTFSNFKSRNSRCPFCECEAISKRCKTPYQTLESKAKERGLTLLTTKEEYEKNSKKNNRISLQCKCGYFYTIRVTQFNTGRSCLKCGFKKTGDKKRKTYEEVKRLINLAGYELLSAVYNGNNKKLELECKDHGSFFIKLNDILSGHGCRKCFCRGGKAQKELFDFVKNLYPETLEENRKLIKPKELDIFVPSLGLAIEYCGLRWHSDEFKSKNDHYNKMKLCNEKSIRLITVFEDEWLEKQEQVKNFLLSVLNKNSTKLMARKTEIKVVTKTEATDFLDNHHIQGAPLLEIAFGLCHNNELQAVITGNKHHRQGFDDIFVLNRLAFKSGVSISGGSSKLLKALINYAKNNGYKKLISWSDNRWSEGNVYEKLGFELTEELGPDYSYVQKQKRLSKQSCKKKNLLQRGAKGTMENTEQELALSLGLYRIWDCGKKRWEINL
jgi:N-acetylglutamate synthase-like GNAT family acetyltransferase